MIRELVRQGVAMIARRRRRPPEPAAAPTLDRCLRSAGLSFEDCLQRFLNGAPPVYGGLADAGLRMLAARYPQHAARVIAAADDIARHQFNFLGSGPFHCVDSGRAPVGDYVPIDWYVDPVRGLRFAQKVPHREWDYFAMRPGDADIKYPWELSRCQGWVTLGQAFLLTGDDRYGKEIADQLRDFMEANPTGLGINWTCTMDVAIRAANWTIALNQIRSCTSLDEHFWREACDALFAHGAFIFDNLENHYEVTSNHFLSNVVGLYFVGAVFAHLEAGAEWIAFARKSVEQELAVQVCADGSDFESSIPYHRLVTELFLGAARLADLHAAPFSRHFNDRLAAMVQFQAGTLRPDGLMPQVGDADDGRLHIFAGVGRWTAQDARHLFGPATGQCKSDAWRDYLNEDAIWEAAWWGFDTGTMAPSAGPLPAHATLYPDAGIAVAREQGNFVLVSNGRVGTEGFGNHKHNDLLGFEYHHAHQPWVVDPGSYVYTSDFDARNAFRSIRAHNTLQLGDYEPNEFREDWLFRMFEKAEPEHLGFEQNETYVQYAGRHRGYERVEGGGVHTRIFRYQRRCGALAIADRLAGAGVHVLRWRLHLAPGVSVQQTDAGRAVLAAGDARLDVYGPRDAALSVQDDWYSPAYGIRLATQCLVFTVEQQLAADSCWSMVLCPDGDAAAAQQLARQLESLWPAF